jgi:hypothetical protein
MPGFGDCIRKKSVSGSVLDSSEIREKEGRLNEFYKYAAELARLRFEEYYKYDNDQIDRPFLTPEAEEKNNV